MSVVTVVQARRVRYQGHDNLGLPIGIWAGLPQAAGDASGGSRVLRIEFNPGAAPRDSQFYSLEAMTVDDADTTAKAFRLRMENISIASQPLVNRVIAGNLIAGGLGLTLAIPSFEIAGFKQFLGTQRIAGVTSAVSVEMVNVDLAVCNFYAAGYIWGVRSLNAVGGPQRPPGGLFRD